MLPASYRNSLCAVPMVTWPRQRGLVCREQGQIHRPQTGSNRPARRPSATGVTTSSVFLTGKIIQRRSLKRVSSAHAKNQNQSSLEKTNEADGQRRLFHGAWVGQHRRPVRIGLRASAPARWLSTAPPPYTDSTVTALLLTGQGNEAEREYGFIQDRQAEKRGEGCAPRAPLAGTARSRGACACHPSEVLHAKTAMLPTTRSPVESCTQSKGRRSRDNGALG